MKSEAINISIEELEKTTKALSSNWSDCVQIIFNKSFEKKLAQSNPKNAMYLIANRISISLILVLINKNIIGFYLIEIKVILVYLYRDLEQINKETINRESNIIEFK